MIDLKGRRVSDFATHVAPGGGAQPHGARGRGGGPAGAARVGAEGDGDGEGGERSAVAAGGAAHRVRHVEWVQRGAWNKLASADTRRNV